MRDIVANGLNSIRVGLEDFEQAAHDPARLTSAVRNIYAGILILAKGKLYEISPPGSQGVLIRVVQPKLVDQRLELVPQGRKTIAYEEIKKRFQHFRLPLDWDKVDRIGAIRNDLEHFYHAGAPSNVQEAVADAATVIRHLLDLLGLDPVGSLGQRPWEILLGNRALFEQELADCRATFDQVRWISDAAREASAYFECKECRSPLIRQADDGNEDQATLRGRCVACGTESDMYLTIEQGLTNQYGAELYAAYSQGGEMPTVRCPQCHHYTLVVDGGTCAACGQSLSDDTQWCENCYNPLSAAEWQDGTHECPPFFRD